MKIKDKIIKLLKERNDLSVKEMIDLLQVSKQAIHKSIIQLLEADEIIKFGKVPKTIYRLKEKQLAVTTAAITIDDKSAQILQKNFLLVTETGEMKEGLDGFANWCRQRKLPVEKTITEFLITKAKYEQYYNKLSLIDGNEKLQNTKGYNKIFLDQVYYLDFYAIERFGKTRLGTLLHYAKQVRINF